MNKTIKILEKRINASTLVELLFTMIISGIIFLFVIDGVDIIKRFSHNINNRISFNHNLLYSHQLMEHLVENTDSIVKIDNQLLLYSKGIVSDSLIIKDAFFILAARHGIVDTLFAGYTNHQISALQNNINHIDSLFISFALNNNDTIWLEYGLPSNYYSYLNTNDNEDSK